MTSRHPCSAPVRSRRPGRERGVVLFIALIALVVMTMGALSLYRSVDSITAVAGNVGFRQKGVATTSTSVEEARQFLLTANVNADSPSDGYYASWSAYVNDDDMLKFDWSKAKKLTDKEGYQRWYVIHRLCLLPGEVNTLGQSCIKTGGTTGVVQSSGSQVEGERVADSSSGSDSPPYYRITARALGPRNAESIVQVIVF